MKLEDQVLSIEQVQELQELGFDVRKHASLYFVEEKYFVKENFIVLPEQIDITRVPEDVKITPTLTIGDIIEVLPQRITMNNTGYILKTLHKFDISYTDCAGRKLNAFNLSLETLNLIDALFEMLKWCIINKHIG